VAELVVGWDGINPEKPGVAESMLVCICPELEGTGTTGPVDLDFCLLEVLGAFAAEAPLAGGFLSLDSATPGFSGFIPSQPRTSSATLSLSQFGQSHSQENQDRVIA
jgi:hypothetical protein